jgi:hypothetical protein
MERSNWRVHLSKILPLVYKVSQIGCGIGRPWISDSTAKGNFRRYDDLQTRSDALFNRRTFYAEFMAPSITSIPLVHIEWRPWECPTGHAYGILV